MTTVLGSASACSRAARFGVSPTTACSCAAPAPIRSPTTTSPVAMPTRTCKGLAAAIVELRHRLDERKPRPHRALGIVLVGLRITEIEQARRRPCTSRRSRRTRSISSAQQLLIGAR